MGTMRTLSAPAAGVRLADAVVTFLDTIAVANTRRGYAIPLNRPGTPEADPSRKVGPVLPKLARTGSDENWPRTGPAA